MSRHDKLYDKISRNPDNVRWRDFYALCEFHFGEPVRQSGGHIIFKLPSWEHRGVLAVQPAGKRAKGYQVRQALKHIERIRDGHC